MSPTIAYYVKLDGGFPRVSGDEPALTDAPADVRVFSPRERG